MKEHIDLVAFASVLINLANLLFVHWVKRQFKKSKKKKSDNSHKIDAVQVELGIEVGTGQTAAGAIAPNNNQPIAGKVILGSNAAQNDLKAQLTGDLLTSFEGEQEARYQSKASKDAFVITVFHLLFDLLLRLSVLFSALMIKYWNWDEFDYYCSFFVAAMMIGTLIPVVIQAIINLRVVSYDMSQIIDKLSDFELKLIRKNSLIVHEGKKRLLLIIMEEDMKKRINHDYIPEFCHFHKLDRIIWKFK